jgi:hypothetical protein
MSQQEDQLAVDLQVAREKLQAIADTMGRTAKVDIPQAKWDWYHDQWGLAYLDMERIRKLIAANRE